MKISRNFLKVRGNIAFASGLILAASLAYTVENRGNLFSFGFQSGLAIKTSPLQLKPVKQRPLSDAEFQMGVTAWQYFQKNTQTSTGLVNAVDGFPSTTLWDQASYLLGLISAYRLGIIKSKEFDSRLGNALVSIAAWSLFDDKLPNKVYNTETLEKTDYTNMASENGVGWSALDVARMIVPLEIVIRSYPRHSSAAQRILGSWQLQELVAGGALQGARIDAKTGQTERVQEGRLGYEEYAARAAALIALDTGTAARHDLNIRQTSIYDIEIISDRRDLRAFGASNFVLSEPYILTALELGLDQHAAELAHRILQVQQLRYLDTGIPTAVSEDHIDQEPFFLYNSILVNGKTWVSVSETGEMFNNLKTLSTKAAIAWDMIYDTEYTAVLRREAQKTRSPGSGWFAGIYESDGRINQAATANTNGIILEALHYRVFGPLFQP